MEWLKEINEYTIIICNNYDKEKILKEQVFKNIKIYSLEEIIKKYYFSYDEFAILYMMNKYHLKYDIAEKYINNLYYIDYNKTTNNSKLNFLSQIKKELENEKLLTYDSWFHNHIINSKVIIYDYYLNKFTNNMLNNFKNVQIITKKYDHYEHNSLEFNNINDEVEFVADSICNLLNKGININDIYLTNIDKSYYPIIDNIFSMFNIPINISYKTTISSYKYIKDFINDYLNNTLEDAVNNLDKTNRLYNILIDTLNKYIKYNNKELIIYKLRHTHDIEDKYQNAINIVDYHYYDFTNKYVFMLNFNETSIPTTYKDEDYLTDNIKEELLLENTIVKNIKERELTINCIYNIKNLVITYKLNDNKKNYYPSNLTSIFPKIKIENNIISSYCETLNKLKLASAIDNLLKYGYKDPNLDLLYNNYHINYNSYDNKYKLINRTSNNLTLSYTKMQLYNKCAFRYYLTDILKLDTFESNMSTILGSLSHYILEKCLSNDNYNINEYTAHYLNSNYPNKIFTNKEKFFINIYQKNINNALIAIKEQMKYCSLNNAMYEKKIDIKYNNSIKFTGVIDKILYKEQNNQTIVSIIDYKTGNDKITLKYLDYGLYLQLPTYLYLMQNSSLKNIVYSGFYLQHLDYSNNSYILEGYSNSDKQILSLFDKNYFDSDVIKGLKTNKDGSFKANSKVLNTKEINDITIKTEKQIQKFIKNILDNQFTINPKVINKICIGCEFCQFKDICFRKEEDKVEIYFDKEEEGDI